MHFSRLLPRSDRSFLLFGPRGVGKSTWLKENFKDSQRIDLLSHRAYLDLSRDPGRLEELIEPKTAKHPILIDEIQKVPALLDEVHRLMEDHRWVFGLTGSSARGLKKQGANLLAGRASVLKMEAFSAHEMGQVFDLSRALTYGTLPLVVQAPDEAVEILDAYVHTYLKEEIQAEGIVRKVDPFLRFLEVSGRLNGQVVNLENVAREARVPRASVQAYFSILEDTLIGHRLAAFQPGAKVREVSHPKFYWFDPGVARGAAGQLRNPVDEVSRGFLLETLIFRELRIYNEVSSKKNKMAFYRTGGGDEIDFIIELEAKQHRKKSKVICIEVKASATWDRRWEKPALNLTGASQLEVKKSFGVYLGKEPLYRPEFTVLPFDRFVKALFEGEVF